MGSSLIESTWLPAWLADLRNVNEITFKTLGRNLDAYAGSVAERIAVDSRQEQALAAALSASQSFIEQCYGKSLTVTVQSLPSRSTAIAAVEALVAALDGARPNPDDFL